MRRQPTKDDLSAITRMIDYLGSIQFWWPNVAAADKGDTHTLHELDAAWNNTGKHLQGMVQGEREARYAVEMATVIAGGAEQLRRRPPMSNLIGTVQPLINDKDGIEAALVFAEAGIPVCFVTMPTYGTTAPATKAGAYVMGFAELVSATVLRAARAPRRAGHPLPPAGARRPAHGRADHGAAQPPRPVPARRARAPLRAAGDDRATPAPTTTCRAAGWPRRRRRTR